MRNSVKATVDAYDGTVKLYQWDDQDPILKAWSRGVPRHGARRRAEITADLWRTCATPRTCSRCSATMFARYHVTDRADLLRRHGQLAGAGGPRPTSRTSDGSAAVLLPDTAHARPAGPQFSLSSVYVPHERSNLAGFISVDSDPPAPDYGKITGARAAQRRTPSPDPGQIANQLVNDPDGHQLTAEVQSRSGHSSARAATC